MFIKLKRAIITLSMTILSIGLFAHEVPDFSAMKDWGGGLILIPGSESYTEQEKDYAFKIYSDEQHQYLVLELSVERIKDKAVWDYLDHIVLPTHKNTHRLIHGLCSQDGEYDGRIAAIVLSEDKEELGGAIVAWSADLSNKQLNEIPTTGVTCINEGYGV